MDKQNNGSRERLLYFLWVLQDYSFSYMFRRGGWDIHLVTILQVYSLFSFLLYLYTKFSTSAKYEDVFIDIARFFQIQCTMFNKNDIVNILLSVIYKYLKIQFKYNK